MTDKEIAGLLKLSRSKASIVADMYCASNSYDLARESVEVIHHIINSINWED